MTKRGKKNREYWKRLLEKESFQEQVRNFQRDVGLPVGGFTTREEHDEWYSSLSSASKKELDQHCVAFTEEIIKEYHLEDHEMLFELALASYVRYTDHEALDHHFEAVGHDVAIVDVARSLSSGRLNPLKEMAARGTFLFIGPNASKPDVINYLERKNTWGMIKAIRELKGFSPSAKRVRTRTKREVHRAIYEHHKKGNISTLGEVSPAPGTFLVEVEKVVPELSRLKQNKKKNPRRFIDETGMEQNLQTIIKREKRRRG